MSAAARSSPEGKLRIDRWLWCARLFKTRGIAAEAVKGGHVRVNGQRVKPAREIQAGDRLDVLRGEQALTLMVRAIPQRRGPAGEAAQCYEETLESVERRAHQARERAVRARLSPAPTPGRPDKRTRRLIRRTTGRP